MTTQEANDLRKGLIGKEAYIAFVRYQQSTNQTDQSVDRFQEWDLVHNFGALRESFGTDEYLIGVAVRHKYQTVLNQYSILLLERGADAAKITLAGVRLTKDGTKKLISEMDEADHSYQIGRLKMTIQHSASRLHQFQHNWNTVRETVTGWLFEMEEEAKAS